MDNLNIVFLNCAARGFDSTLSWEERLKKIIELITYVAPDAFLINLCEFLPGKFELETGENKYIRVVNENLPDYIIVFPLGFDKFKNFKSGINIILINKRYYKSHDIRELDLLQEGKYLYNYIGLNSSVGYYRVINAHFPVVDSHQADWFQKKREALGDLFETVISEELEKYKDEPDIPLIFTADLNRGYDSDFLKKITSSEDPLVIDSIKKEDKSKPTYKSTTKGSSHIDYMFYSTGMNISDVFNPNLTELINETLNQKLSDHVLLLGSITVDVETVNETI